MFTKWWKNCVKGMVAFSGSPNKAFNLPIKNVSNATYYFSGIRYPYTTTTTFQLTATSNGIHVGTGNTAATEDDYALESPVTSGLAGTVTINKDMDANGNPYITYNLVLSNSTSADIVVKEIGLYESCSCGNTVGATSSSERNFLVDRTVLDTPVTVPANGNAAIYYTLKTTYTTS